MGKKGIEPLSPGLEPGILPLNDLPLQLLIKTLFKKVYKFLLIRLNMPKKSVKKITRKKTQKRTSTKSDINKKILENFVELQKVNTELAIKIDKLTHNISDLLELFENAAKSFSSHPAVRDSEKDKEFLNKIDKLLDQNKTIARGLTLMEEKVRERIKSPTPQQYQNPTSHYQSPSQPSRPLPRF
jgi:hypothetical protein